jgi:hypothetical protein
VLPPRGERRPVAGALSGRRARAYASWQSPRVCSSARARGRGRLTSGGILPYLRGPYRPHSARNLPSMKSPAVPRSRAAPPLGRGLRRHPPAVPRAGPKVHRGEALPRGARRSLRASRSGSARSRCTAVRDPRRTTARGSCSCASGSRGRRSKSSPRGPARSGHGWARPRTCRTCTSRSSCTSRPIELRVEVFAPCVGRPREPAGPARRSDGAARADLGLGALARSVRDLRAGDAPPVPAHPRDGRGSPRVVRAGEGRAVGVSDSLPHRQGRRGLVQGRHRRGPSRTPVTRHFVGGKARRLGRRQRRARGSSRGSRPVASATRRTSPRTTPLPFRAKGPRAGLHATTSPAHDESAPRSCRRPRPPSRSVSTPRRRRASRGASLVRPPRMLDTDPTAPVERGARVHVLSGPVLGARRARGRPVGDGRGEGVDGPPRDACAGERARRVRAERETTHHAPVLPPEARASLKSPCLRSPYAIIVRFFRARDLGVG